MKFSFLSRGEKFKSQIKWSNQLKFIIKEQWLWTLIYWIQFVRKQRFPNSWIVEAQLHWNRKTKANKFSAIFIGIAERSGELQTSFMRSSQQFIKATALQKEWKNMCNSLINPDKMHITERACDHRRFHRFSFIFGIRSNKMKPCFCVQRTSE